MSNAHVVKLQTELTSILERAFDRTTRAINDSRSGTYTGTQLYKDATDALVDGVYGTLLPFLEFLPFSFAPQPPLPVARFEFETAVDDIVSIPLVTSGVTKAISGDLVLSTTQTIAAKYVAVQIAGNDLVVKVMGASVKPAPAIGTYAGDIVADNLPGKPVIGQISVRWFVI